MDRSSKSVWGASKIDVGGNYKLGRTGMIAFGKTAQQIIEQGYDEMGWWSSIVFEGEENKVILITSIY